MATNQRGHGKRVHITATAAFTSGQLVYVDGFHGVCVNDIADTEDGVIDIEQVEYELPLVATAVRGDAIYIKPADQVLTKTSATNRLAAIVTAVAADDVGVPAGSMWVLLMPQAVGVAAA